MNQLKFDFQYAKQFLRKIANKILKLIDWYVSLDLISLTEQDLQLKLGILIPNFFNFNKINKFH